MACFPGDSTPVEIVRHDEHGSGDHQSSALALGCHVGTHIDLPLHFRAGEPGLDRFPLAQCWGQARLVAAPCGPEPGALTAAVLDGVDLAGIDFVILHTGWGRHWGTPRYYETWPHLDPQLTERLAASELKGVGLDGPSVDPLGGRAAHDRLAACGMINIENLGNLAALDRDRFELFVMPLRLDGTEASPVRAAAIVVGDRS
jgi:kynurenine formamidase